MRDVERMDHTQQLLSNMRNDARQAEHHIDLQFSCLDRLAAINERNVCVPDDETTASSSALVVGEVHAGGGYSPGGGDVAATLSGDGGDSATGNGCAAAYADGRGGNGVRERRRPLREVIGSFEDARQEIESSLTRYDQLVQSMADISRSLPSTSPAVRHVERMQHISFEKWRTLRRLVADFNQRRERLELIPSVHKDIEKYERESGVCILMKEQKSLRYTQKKLEQILGQAEDTHSQLREQRMRFTAMADKLVGIVDRVPAIHNVLRRISAKRRRNVVVISFVLAICLFLTIIFI